MRRREEADDQGDPAAAAECLAALPDEARASSRESLDALAPTLRLFAETLGPNKGTKVTYMSLFRGYLGWCALRELRALPAHPETLVAFARALAQDRSYSTIKVSLSVVFRAHAMLGYAEPRSEGLNRTLRELREVAVARKPAPPMDLTSFRRIMLACRGDPLASRDRALLTLMYFGSIGWADAAALDCTDIRVVPRGGLLVRLPAGLLPLPTHADPELCPAAAHGRWLLDRAQMIRLGDAGPREPMTSKDGPLFVSVRRSGRRATARQRIQGRDVSRVLQRRGALADVEPRLLTVQGLRAGVRASLAQLRARPHPSTAEAILLRYLLEDSR